MRIRPQMVRTTSLGIRPWPYRRCAGLCKLLIHLQSMLFLLGESFPQTVLTMNFAARATTFIFIWLLPHQVTSNKQSQNANERDQCNHSNPSGSPLPLPTQPSYRGELGYQTASRLRRKRSLCKDQLRACPSLRRHFFIGSPSSSNSYYRT